MPEQIGIRALRDNLTATIRRVSAGETIDVTHHGRRVAVLAPARDDRIDRLSNAGDITPGTSLERALRTYPVTGSQSASQALEDDRAER